MRKDEHCTNHDHIETIKNEHFMKSSDDFLPSMIVGEGIYIGWATREELDT